MAKLLILREALQDDQMNALIQQMLVPHILPMVMQLIEEGKKRGENRRGAG